MPAASGGVIQVGFSSELFSAGRLPPPVQFIGNPDSCELLMLENRYAGPLGIQWADSDIQVGAGLIGQGVGPFINVPPLSRMILPWPKDYGVNFTHRQTGQGATYFNGANTTNAIPQFWNYQLSNVKYWWLDGSDVMGEWPLYPTHARIALSRQQVGITQGVSILLHHVLPFQTATASFATGTFCLLGGVSSQVGPPFPFSQDARIMRVMVVYLGGTGLLQDLEITPAMEISGYSPTLNSFGSNHPAASLRAYGSTAVATSNANPAEWIEIPGSPGVIYENNAGAAGSTLQFHCNYEIAVPID